MIFSDSDFLGYLAELKNEKVTYHPNPGNAGDAIIAAGTYKLLDEVGLNYCLFNPSRYRNDNTLIYGGGGNFVPFYSDCNSFLSSYHGRAKRLILLPHTIDGNEELLGELGSNVDIFCREQRSYNHVRRSTTRANVYLYHDLALTLDKDFIMAGGKPVVPDWYLHRSFRNSSRNYKRATKDYIGGIQPGSEKVLSAFRCDVEEKGAVPVNNIDLSSFYKYNTKAFSPRRTRAIVKWLSGFIDQFEVVNTNRLHLGILSSILNKQVNFYPNNYWKNREIYEFSLQNKFKNMTWGESEHS